MPEAASAAAEGPKGAPTFAELLFYRMFNYAPGDLNVGSGFPELNVADGDGARRFRTGLAAAVWIGGFGGEAQAAADADGG